MSKKTKTYTKQLLIKFSDQEYEQLLKYNKIKTSNLAGLSTAMRDVILSYINSDCIFDPDPE